VNGKHVSLRYLLNDGDLVEVKTSRQAKPSKNWMEILSSPRARQRVRAWFRKQELEDALALGKSIFEKELKKQTVHLTDQHINELAVKFKFSGQQEFFASIGQGNLLMEKVLEILIPDNLPPESIALPAQDKDFSVDSSKPFVELDGLENLMIHFAKCCHPLPGVEIIGYITRGRGLSVHRKDCPNPAFQQLCQREPHRLLQLHWQKSPDSPNLIITRLNLIILPRPRLNYELTSLLAQLQINTLSSSSRICGDHEEIELLVETKNKSQLKRLKNSLLSIKGILEVR
jgi:GTP pyrophosphokinase